MVVRELDIFYGADGRDPIAWTTGVRSILDLSKEHQSATSHKGRLWGFGSQRQAGIKI